MAKHAVRSLIVLPDDTAKPLLDAIRSAKDSLRVKTFALSDPAMLQALIASSHRGVKTRVMLSPDRGGDERPHATVAQMLFDADIEVLDGNPDFSVTHEKSMVVDESAAFVQSLNWETENFKETRDYAVLTRDPEEVREIVQCFEADWTRKEFKPGERSSLIWCPWNGRPRLAYFIDHAQESLIIQNERFHDTMIIERLVRAKLRGVKVHIITRPARSLDLEKLVEGAGGLQIMHDVGIKIHKLKGLKLHAKMLLADGCRAIIGSINITVGSFDKRRELAIEVTDDAVVDRLQAVAEQDWKNSKPLDVTDDALKSDLERRHRDDLLSPWRATYEPE